MTKLLVVVKIRYFLSAKYNALFLDFDNFIHMVDFVF